MHWSNCSHLSEWEQSGPHTIPTLRQAHGSIWHCLWNILCGAWSQLNTQSVVCCSDVLIVLTYPLHPLVQNFREGIFIKPLSLPNRQHYLQILSNLQLLQSAIIVYKPNFITWPSEILTCSNRNLVCFLMDLLTLLRQFTTKTII